jgi:toluene monooxygenase system protein E
MGRNVPGNQWLFTHRDGIALTLLDWDAFRDPDQLTYRKYTHDMDAEETYVDGLLQEYTEARDADQALSEGACDFLHNCLTPCRYLGHGLQMASAYVQQLAPSSYVGNCAAFQTADQLRRVQRVAYRTKQLALAHPAHGFGRSERLIWEQRELWQPIRQSVETLLVAYDWDEAFVGLNLVVKPIADEIFLRAFGPVARELGDELDALINDNLYRDAQRSRRWTVALCRWAADANPSNRGVLRGRLRQWTPSGEALLAAGCRLLAAYSTKHTDAALQRDMRAAWAVLLADAGLRDE